MKPLPDSFQHVGHTVGLSVFFSVQCTVGLTWMRWRKSAA